MKREFGVLLLILLLLFLVLSKVSVENKSTGTTQQAEKKETGFMRR